jgi:hypothetical protein
MGTIGYELAKDNSMIRADQIPDEVVEAAARAAYEMDAGSPSDTWEQASKLAKVIYRGNARAAIAAAINAWPRLKGCWDEDETGLHRCLLLPLPQTGDA